jgi:glycosyltransferase involved in cell wall biosynthesis
VISFYTTCYNILTNGFLDWQERLKNHAEFADELIIVVNKSEDETETAVKDFLAPYKNWKVVSANFSKLDPLFDGRLKNLALQNTTQEFKVQIDLDEGIGLWQRPLWENKLLQLKFSGAKVMAVPSVDLYKDLGHYKAINWKTYVNIGQAYRGPSLKALKPGYFINTQFSDGTELIDENFNVLPAVVSGPCDLSALESGEEIFVNHYGYVSIEERIKRTEKFWHEHWLQESGGTLPAHKIHHDESTFSHYECKPHKLRLA